MDSSGLGGGFLSGNGGLLDLESPIRRPQKTQLVNPSLTQRHQLNMMSNFEGDHQSIGILDSKSLGQKDLLMAFNRGKAIASACITNNYTSEEDEPSYTEDGECSEFLKGKKGSPWQRMKWTDEIVRLLIAVVACVGDDGEAGMGSKRKSGILHKKGKWRTVSKIMQSKGCHVSPQQCEDKFNDLNKRYKRLNDILGKGTSCRVVENPALMDSMPHLSSKAKDDVRKILSSKHLFYKEMCAYHNGQTIPGCQDVDFQGKILPAANFSKGNNESEEAEDSDSDSDSGESDNEDDHSPAENRLWSSESRGRDKVSADDGPLWSNSVGKNEFEGQIDVFLSDPTKSQWERKVWIKKQMLQLQEQCNSFQAQSVELEKQRFKWLRYCSKKNRDLERARLENERMKLDNEQRVLQLKRKEMELESKRSDSAVGPILAFDRIQGREQLDLGMH
ncbi:hypothetical protein IC582_009858 [Cucumis melo]|uniref:Uncharacterized protein LOC103491522 n=2 Tax=Cucumis melo TaxID=3656 RepID=A0A1S3BM36_CUCME|nr:uncharacterized protein LOC103491522 [Cucumis melo]KAA0041403.1 stress response protein nst1 isoform X1 [Cucumis melo var. makuwa]